ncbi:MAG: type II toxin-antitoxin system Phd/YefM family antitoxin [Sinobacteraceae bacterium]|nr:type II toxin-antitoxin system Phd/YefM family antitoxin [Nevskiaceae bacterium]
MENLLTNNELKRRGVAAIEGGLQHGPVHIYKRNQPVAVALSESDYRRLLAAGKAAMPGNTALEWLLAQSSTGTRSKTEIDALLQEERAW